MSVLFSFEEIEINNSGIKIKCQHTWRPSEGGSVGPVNDMVIRLVESPGLETQDGLHFSYAVWHSPTISFSRWRKSECNSKDHLVQWSEVSSWIRLAPNLRCRGRWGRRNIGDSISILNNILAVVFLSGATGYIGIFSSVFWLSYGRHNSKYSFDSGFDKSSIRFLKNCQEGKPFSSQLVQTKYLFKPDTHRSPVIFSITMWLCLACKKINLIKF